MTPSGRAGADSLATPRAPVIGGGDPFASHASIRIGDPRGTPHAGRASLVIHVPEPDGAASACSARPACLSAGAIRVATLETCPALGGLRIVHPAGHKKEGRSRLKRKKNPGQES